MIRLAAAILIVVLFPLTFASAQTVSNPPAPTNLQVVEVGQDYVKLAWGPAQPGEFYRISETKTSLTLAWGLSQDSRFSNPPTYTLTRDGATVASGINTNTYRLTGLNPKTKQFRTCVIAVNNAGQQSPPMCATWTRP